MRFKSVYVFQHCEVGRKHRARDTTASDKHGKKSLFCPPHGHIMTPWLALRSLLLWVPTPLINPPPFDLLGGLKITPKFIQPFGGHGNAAPKYIRIQCKLQKKTWADEGENEVWVLFHFGNFISQVFKHIFFSNYLRFGIRFVYSVFGVRNSISSFECNPYPSVTHWLSYSLCLSIV